MAAPIIRHLNLGRVRRDEAGFHSVAASKGTVLPVGALMEVHYMKVYSHSAYLLSI